MKQHCPASFNRLFRVAIVNSIFCFSQIATAEIISCSERLRYEPTVLATVNKPKWGELSLTKNVATYLNFVEILFEEISKSEADPLNLQIRLLGTLIQSITPFPLFDIYPNTQSHLLSMLQGSATLNKMIAGISEIEWEQIQLIAAEKRDELQRIAGNHEIQEQESEPDFLDPHDLNGRVRLHFLLEKRRYQEAFALLSNPKTTTRYINTRDNNGKTPLDFFEGKQFVIENARNEIDNEMALENQIPSGRLWVGKVIDLLIEKSAKTGEDLESIEQYFLNLPKNPTPSWDKLANQIYEKLDWYYDIGGNLEAVGESNSWINRMNQIFVLNGHMDGLIKLKSLGVDYGYRDKNGENLIHWAASYRQWRLFSFLVRNGVDINAPNNVGESPIFNTLNASDIQITIRILADLGANLNYANHAGETPAHLFSIHCRTEHLKALAQNGADLDLRDQKGRTPLESHRHNNKKTLAVFAEYFISRGIDPESRGLYLNNSSPPTYFRKVNFKE